MKIEQYDKVMLKNGKIATIVEVWEDGAAYEADIDVGKMEWETDTINYRDILYAFTEEQERQAVV